ncbi:hypothetical protein KW783_03375 [Candidatus Parcubacteria bacterium]|nr:hypothetical protein [Candidatus Parcubacteria bacterium]
MINVEVDKNVNENNANLIKRFQKRVQGAGILPRVRSIRYSKRKSSRYVKKKHALKALGRREKMQVLIKLGKVIERSPR